MNTNILKLFTIFIFAILTLSVIFADEGIDAGKKLVNSNVSCNQLNDNQLEQIGDYYMELMHPDQAHVLLEQRLGGEDSLQLRQMHILMAKRLYCQQDLNYNDPTIYNLMNYGMMGATFGIPKTMMSNGMMGYNYGSPFNNSLYYSIFNVTNIIGGLLFIGIIILIVLTIISLKKQHKT